MLSELEQQAQAILFLNQHDPEAIATAATPVRPLPDDDTAETVPSTESMIGSALEAPPFPCSDHVLLYLVWLPDKVAIPSTVSTPFSTEATNTRLDGPSPVAARSTVDVNDEGDHADEGNTDEKNEQQSVNEEKEDWSEGDSQDDGDDILRFSDSVIVPSLQRLRRLVEKERARDEQGTPVTSNAKTSNDCDKPEQAPPRSTSFEESTCNGVAELPLNRKHGSCASFLSSAGPDSGLVPLHVYLVIDRVVPGLVADSWDDECDRMEKFVRLIASHPDIRPWCEGITLGLSNHERAAPGLEACLGSVSKYAADRRRHAAAAATTASSPILPNQPDARSHLTLVAVRPEDCLGLADAQVTDAAQGILQQRWMAEWSGHGNIWTFAARGQNQWLQARGLPLMSLDRLDARHLPFRRKMPRRLTTPRASLQHPEPDPEIWSSGRRRRTQGYKAAFSRAMEDLVQWVEEHWFPANVYRDNTVEQAYDLCIALFLLFYLWFHCRNHIYELIVTMVGPDHLMFTAFQAQAEWIQLVRELW
jgi:hypothetical protein